MAAHEFTDACSAEPVTLAQTMVALEATQVERSAALRALDGNVNAEDRFRVLSSGILAYRLPPTAHGREVWFDPVKRVKLCEHGYTMAQIHHWRCPARPRTRPPWVECTCQDAKGLYVDPLAKPDLTDGALVPPYHRVLWRDGEPTRLDYKGILAVRVPGYPKGHEVYVDAYGTTRCPHGFTESTLRHRRQRQKACAATLLQRWWRGVRHAACESQSARACTWSVVRQWRSAEASSSPVQRDTCACSAAGLRRNLFGTHQRRKRDRGGDVGRAVCMTA